MAQGLVGPDPGDPGRERLGQQQVVEEVPAVVAQPGHRGAVVAPVERPEEVTAVAAVQGEQGGRLGHQVGHEGGPLARRQVARGQPGVGVDHVGGDQGVLEVEGGHVPVGGEDVLPGPVGPVRLDRPARGRAHPGVLDDRGQVDVVDVDRPVHGGGVEAERGPVVLVHPVPQGDEAVDPVQGVGLGVGAVELDVAQGPVSQQVLLLEGGHPLGLLAPDGQRPDDPLGQAHGLRGPGELALDPSPPGERPLRHHDGLPVLVVERVLLEPGGDQFDQPPVAERVPHPRGHLVDRRAGVGVGRVVGVGVQEGLPGHGDDGRHHQVDGDHVGHPFGDPGELAQQAPGVGDDDRLGHPEPADPPRSGLGQGGLDDRRADDGEGDGVAVLRHQCPLAQGLGVRIGVGPPEGLGPGLADGDHLLLDPVLAQPLGPLGEQMEAGPAQLLAGRLVELLEPLGPPGLGLAVAPLATGGGHLVAPVDLHGERVGVEQLLPGLALVGAGHVRRRHRHEVDGAAPAVGHGQFAGGHEGPGHPGRPQEVDLHGRVQGGVEADRGGRVDHHVAAGQGVEPGGVQTEPVGGHVAGHRAHPGVHLVVEPVAQLLTQAVEAVVLQDLLGRPLTGRGPPAGADQQDDPAVGDAAQDAFDQGGPQEPGGAGDEEAPARQGVTDAGHPICLPYGK